MREASRHRHHRVSRVGGLNRRAMISRTVDEGRRGGARRNYKEARIGKQSDGGMARPLLRLMRFLCLSFRSKATWGDLRLDRASS